MQELDSKKSNLPMGYIWEEGKGLFQVQVKNRITKGKRFITDGIPCDVHRIRIQDANAMNIKDIISFQIVGKDGKNLTSTPLEFDENLQSYKVIKNLILPYLIFDSTKDSCNEAVRVFDHVLKLSKRGIEPEIHNEKVFGWNSHTYEWKAEITKNQIDQYGNAMTVFSIADQSEILIPALVMSACHGILLKPFLDAGIEHDYVDVILAKTGIGKSSAVKCICDYRAPRSNFISVGSNRKALKKELENCIDQTVCIDDFCKSSSDRVLAYQNQLVSEIIQSASDSVRVLVNETSNIDSSRRHLILTAEQMIMNESTINRCFIVKITEALSQETFSKMREAAHQDVFYRFLVGFSYFISENYSEQSHRSYSDYKMFLNKMGQSKNEQNSSSSRINETYAVQMTIGQAILRYLRMLQLPSECCDKVERKISYLTETVCKDMVHQISELRGIESHKCFLPALTKFVLGLGKDEPWCEYNLADSEEKYKNPKKKGYQAFQCHGGYISFESKKVCTILKEDYGVENITPKGLATELRYYALAHVDCEGKISCRWGTGKRYYHVNVRSLLELMTDENDNNVQYTLNEVFIMEQY